MSEPNSGWKNWGDYPPFVILSTVGILLGILVPIILYFAGRDGSRPESDTRPGPGPTPSMTLVKETPEPTPDQSKIKDALIRTFSGNNVSFYRDFNFKDSSPGYVTFQSAPISLDNCTFTYRSRIRMIRKLDGLAGVDMETETTVPLAELDASTIKAQELSLAPGVPLVWSVSMFTKDGENSIKTRFIKSAGISDSSALDDDETSVAVPDLANAEKVAKALRRTVVACGGK